MRVLIETTNDWKTHYRVPCHTYYLEGYKVLAYIPEGSARPVVFPKPWNIDLRGRSFRYLNRYPALPKMVEVSKTVEVKGSKGQMYQVVPGVSCTCPGFKFRGACKHLALVK